MLLERLTNHLVSFPYGANQNLQFRKILMDSRKIYEFKIRKSEAGNISQKLSLTFSLTSIPKNINKAKPPEDIIKIKLNIKPASKPKAPVISKIAVNLPILLNPKRENSIFIFGDVKYVMPYIKKEKLEKRIKISSRRIKKLY